ncbi:unnamed protein product [Withania somnifera]
MATHSFSLLTIQSLTSNSTNRQSDSNSFVTHNKYYKSLATTFTGGNLLVRPQTQNLNVFTIKRRRSIVATVAFSLPIAQTEGGKQPKWSARSIQAFVMAELEARKLKYPNTGTEALLMGILVEGTSLAAKLLRANGVTLLKVRDEIVKLLGRSDLYYFPQSEDGEITITYIALGIWSVKESAGHKIMATLGFDDEKAKELAKFMDKEIEMSHK